MHWAYEVTVDERLQRSLQKIVHPDVHKDLTPEQRVQMFAATLNAAVSAQRGAKRLEAERRRKAEAEREKRRAAAAMRKAAK